MSNPLPQFNLFTADGRKLVDYFLPWLKQSTITGNDLPLDMLHGRIDPCCGELIEGVFAHQTPASLESALATARARWLPIWQRHIDAMAALGEWLNPFDIPRDAALENAMEKIGKGLLHRFPIDADMNEDEDVAIDQLVVMSDVLDYLATHFTEDSTTGEYNFVTLPLDPQAQPWPDPFGPWPKQLARMVILLWVRSKMGFPPLEAWDGDSRFRSEPPVATLLPFVIQVASVGYEPEVHQTIIADFRRTQRVHAEMQFKRFGIFLHEFLFGRSPYQLIQRVAATMERPDSMSDLFEISKAAGTFRETHIAPLFDDFKIADGQ